MEKIQAEGPKPHALRIVVVLALVAFLVTCALFALGRFLHGYSLRDALSPDVPVLELHVAFLDTFAKGKGGGATANEPAGESRGALSSPSPGGETPSAEPCPTVYGGDLGATAPPPRRYPWEPTPIPCPLKATWRVYRNPVAASLFFVRGAQVLAWYEAHPKVLAWRESDLWKGLMQQLAGAVKVRAEELQLSDWKGEFLQPLVREALQADGSLHYDLIHGAGGFLFAFNRAKAPLLDKALPILIRGLATNAYDAQGYEQPLIEVRFLGRTFFVTQVGERVVLASSLEGLLNIVEQRPFTAPHEDGTLVAVVRPESFMDKLLTSSVGITQWPISLGFELSATESEVTGATIPRARVFQSLAANTASGVLAAIPHDILAAVALSSHVPLDRPVSEWSLPKAAPPEPAGLGLVWDLSGSERRFDVGFAVQAPTSGEGISEGATRPSDFVSSKGVTTTCAGGAVWLAASSDRLLGRMRESCERQSLSIRDLKGVQQGVLEAQQVALVFNTAVWLHELFVLGAEASAEPRYGASTGESSDLAADPEGEARKGIARMVDQVAHSLPILGLMGRLSVTQEDLRLKGFTASSGGV